MTSLSLKKSHDYYDQLYPDNQYQYSPETNQLCQALAKGWHITALTLIRKSQTFEELVPKKNLHCVVYSIFKTKNSALINETIEKCQSLIFLYDNWGRTPLFWARYHRLPQIANELHNRGLHHYFSLNLHPQNLELSVCLFSPRNHKMVDSYKRFLHMGSFHEFITPIFRELWWQYYDNFFKYQKNVQKLKTLPNKIFCDKISHCFLLAATNAHPNILMSQYTNNEMVIVPTGWHHHAINIVFFRNIVLWCNKGESSYLQKASLQIYRFDPTKLHSGIFKKILASKYASKNISELFLYKSLLKILNAFQDSFCIAAQKRVHLKDQKYSNCTVTCDKVALFGLCLCIHEKEKILDEETYQITRQFYKGFTSSGRNLILDKYVNNQYDEYVIKMLGL